jgi:hypothetical protein
VRLAGAAEEGPAAELLRGGYAMVSRVLVAFDVPPPEGEIAG